MRTNGVFHIPLLQTILKIISKRLLVISFWLFLITFLLAGSSFDGYASLPTVEKAKTILYVYMNSGPKPYRYVLTHRGKEKLETPVSFVIGLSPKWTLHLKDGKKIYYTIIYQNIITPMCQVQAKDSFGVNCEICITMEGNAAIVDFKYKKETIRYRGYLSK